MVAITADIVHVVRALMAEHADVHGAPDLATARLLLATSRYDLVILDCALPDGSGLDLITELAAPGQSAPILVFSAYEIGKEAARAVAAALVKSKVSNTELAAKIQELIRTRRSATGELEPKSAAAAGLALDPDRAAMRLD